MTMARAAISPKHTTLAVLSALRRIFLCCRSRVALRGARLALMPPGDDYADDFPRDMTYR